MRHKRSMRRRAPASVMVLGIGAFAHSVTQILKDAGVVEVKA